MSKKTPSSEPEPTFESALERLEQIVDRMEADKLPLEDLILRYEEGIKLVKYCSEKLSAAEKRIELIGRGPGGKPELRELEGKPEPPEEPDDVKLF